MRRVLALALALLSIGSAANAQMDTAARGIAGYALTSNAPVNSIPGFVNIGPQQASQLLKDIANVNVTTQTRVGTRWAFVGDSVMAGHCALGACVDSRISSWPFQLAAMLNNAGIPATSDSWFGCSNNTTTGTCATFDTRLTFGTGWTILNQNSFGGTVPNFPASTTPAALTFATAGPWNQLDAYVIAGTAASNFTFDRGGSTAGESCSVISQTGATTTCSGGTVTTTNGTPGLALVRFTFTGNAIAGAVNVNATTNAQGKFYVIGEAVRDTANPKIEIYNGGFGGSTSISWTTGAQAIYGTTSLLVSSFLNPTVTFNGLGVNDWNPSATPISTFQTNMTTLQTAANATGMNVFIFDVQSNPASFASVATQNSYGAVLQGLSTAANQPFINFQYRWTNWANASALGFMGNSGADARHPSATGYQDLASYVASGLIRLTGSNGKYLPGSPTCNLAMPAISSGFGTSPAIVGSNGTCSFQVNVGTGGTANSGVIGLTPAAPNGWTCQATDITTNSTTVFVTKQTASTTSSCTVGNFNDIAAAAAWTASDKLQVIATPY